MAEHRGLCYPAQARSWTGVRAAYPAEGKDTDEEVR